MSKQEIKVIMQYDIANNCPECFNRDMKITFYQRHVFGSLYRRITNTVTHEIQCNTCNSIIYPVN
ncbi:MAG: hypothetical protein AAGA86_10330, partial [Bacteroidota bacterium]